MNLWWKCTLFLILETFLISKYILKKYTFNKATFPIKDYKIEKIINDTCEQIISEISP